MMSDKNYFKFINFKGIKDTRITNLDLEVAIKRISYKGLNSFH